MTNGELLGTLRSLDMKLMTAQWLAESASRKLADGRSKTVCVEAVSLLGILRAIVQNERENVVAELLEDGK